MKGSNILWFIGGAITGSLVAWRLLNNYYKKIADIEIQSVREAFNRERNANKTPINEDKPVVEELKEIAHSATNKPDILEYKERAHEYTTEPMRPYLISQDDFGNCDYECISMTLYSDGVLTDDGDYTVDNIEDIVGETNLDALNDRSTDIIWIRNDERRCDYEIAYDTRAYMEVVGD